MPRSILCALALSAGMTGSLQAQSALTPTERRIADHVAAHADEAVGLLERIVDVNSGTGNLRGVRAVGAILAPELQGIGFNTRWVEMPDSMRRAGHLFAERNPEKYFCVKVTEAIVTYVAIGRDGRPRDLPPE